MAILSYAQHLAELAKRGARIAKEKNLLLQCGKMCETCACKWEQDHILTYFLAADNAANCIMSDTPFHCHTWDFKLNESKPCSGVEFVKLALIEEAKSYIKKINEKENPRRRS